MLQGPRRPASRPRPRRRARRRSRPPRASAIANGTVEGSLALTGGRIDNLVLSNFRETTAPDSPNVRLLNPPGAPDAYFAEFGWVPADQAIAVPGRDTEWQTDGEKIRPGEPVTLTWDNGTGLRFARTVAVDEHYMFTITQRVENTGDEAGLAPPLWPDQPLGHPADARLLHPPRRARSASSAASCTRSTTRICRRTATSNCRA